jgi:hypothetical protein
VKVQYALGDKVITTVDLGEADHPALREANDLLEQAHAMDRSDSGRLGGRAKERLRERDALIARAEDLMRRNITMAIDVGDGVTMSLNAFAPLLRRMITAEDGH